MPCPKCYGEQDTGFTCLKCGYNPNFVDTSVQHGTYFPEREPQDSGCCKEYRKMLEAELTYWRGEATRLLGNECKLLQEKNEFKFALEAIQNRSFNANFDTHAHGYEHACDDINQICQKALKNTPKPRKKKKYE